MTDLRANSERNISFRRGAVFEEIDGEVMFSFVNDASSVIGPRKATKADKAQFAGEWEDFQNGRLPQLDHDGDGRPGGSLAKPAEESENDPALEGAETPKRRGRPPKAKD